MTTSQELNINLKNALDYQIDKIKDSILSRARELATENSDELGLEHLTQALNEFSSKHRKVQNRFFTWFPPFTIVCFILAIAFASFGMASNNTGTVTGFVDIAKIFAGAIVGSTSAVVINNASSKKNQQ